MTTTIKKGQKVWWDDSIQDKSGEYDVLAVDHTRNIVQIGDGEESIELSRSTWKLPVLYRKKIGHRSTNRRTITACWEKGAGIDAGCRFPCLCQDKTTDTLVDFQMIQAIGVSN